jgi:Ca2+-binding RTX toxin-like protein
MRLIRKINPGYNNKANKLRGTRAGDRIRGVGGNDVLRRLGGDDCLNGCRGNDRLITGPDKDKVVADRFDRVAKNCEQVRRK